MWVSLLNLPSADDFQMYAYIMTPPPSQRKEKNTSVQKNGWQRMKNVCFGNEHWLSSHSYTCIPSAGGQLTVDQGYQQELRPNLEQGRTLYVETAQQMHIY